MLSKRRAQKLVKSLSDVEFDVILYLLTQPFFELRAFVIEGKAGSYRELLVVQTLLRECREGGFRLLDAILDRHLGVEKRIPKAKKT